MKMTKTTALAFAALATVAAAKDFDTRFYGAKGDGTTKDTVAIQRAIDACANAGGGRVVLSKGRFLSGMLMLKDRLPRPPGLSTILSSRWDNNSFPA